MVIALGPKRYWKSVKRSFVLRFRSHDDSPVNSRHLTRRSTHCGTWEPRITPYLGKYTVRGTDSDAGEDAGRSECLAVMAGIRVLTLPGSKVSRRPAGLSLQESLRNRLHEGKQMTVISISDPGAASADLTWDTIDWHLIEKHVRRLQTRIAKATAD